MVVCRIAEGKAEVSCVAVKGGEPKPNKKLRLDFLKSLPGS
jgi:hypothetical protein